MQGERGETIDLEALLGNSQRTLTAAAHELKAPLSLIRMYAAQLEKGDLSEAKRQQYTRRLLFTAEHMSGLTNGLLEGQRWQFGQLPLEPVNTRIVCEEVLHELTPAADEWEQSLYLGSASHAGVAVGNAPMLKNVVFNLVYNALQHTPAGSHITLAAARRGERAHVTVTDTGPGFTADAARYVARGDNGRFQAMPSRSGSGLGLAVARQLLAAMNGSLQLKSSPKGGYCLVSLQASRQLALLSEGYRF